jgi:hypothetical protein
MVEHLHIFRDLMEFLKDDYEGRWIRRGQVVCPIQSSDLNTLHYFCGVAYSQDGVILINQTLHISYGWPLSLETK